MNALLLLAYSFLVSHGHVWSHFCKKSGLCVDDCRLMTTQLRARRETNLRLNIPYCATFLGINLKEIEFLVINYRKRPYREIKLIALIVFILIRHNIALYLHLVKTVISFVKYSSQTNIC